MNFRTIVETPLKDLSISYTDKLILMGSCFSENIGNRLVDCKFKTDMNPFGILYNPLSIEKSLRRMLSGTQYTSSDLILHNEIYHSFDHHGSFSGIESDSVLHQINNRLQSSSQFLNEATILLITFGTAFVYTNKQDGKIVSNCHKLPAKAFDRRRVSVEEIVASWSALIKDLQQVNPKLKIIFTVSPIRHIKDGAHENQLSKATLQLSIDQLQKEYNNVFYFPAYEIVLDELRDYRFYADDMTHPASITIDYIWKKFSESYFTKETLDIMAQWLQIAKAISHRPLRPDSTSYKQFILQTLLKVKQIQNKFHFFDIQNEIDTLEKKLESL